MGIKKWLQGLGFIAVVGASDGSKPAEYEGVEEPARAEILEKDRAHAEMYNAADDAYKKAGELQSEAEAREKMQEVAEADFEPMHEKEPKSDLREGKVEKELEGERKRVA